MIIAFITTEPLYKAFKTKAGKDSASYLFEKIYKKHLDQITDEVIAEVKKLSGEKYTSSISLDSECLRIFANMKQKFGTRLNRSTFILSVMYLHTREVQSNTQETKTEQEGKKRAK